MVYDYYRSVFVWFNNPFQGFFGILYLNLPPVAIGISPFTNKKYHCTSDMLLDNISIASKNFLINFTSTCDSLTINFTSSGIPDIDHRTVKVFFVIDNKKYTELGIMIKFDATTSLYFIHMLYSLWGLLLSWVLTNNRRLGLDLLNKNIVWNLLKLIGVFASLICIHSPV